MSRPRVRRGRAMRGAGARRARRGMSLVEVVVAIAILAGVVVAMASAVGQFARTVSTTDLRAEAGEVAAERLETVKGGTNFDALDSAFAEPSLTTVPGRPRFRRQTLIKRVGGAPGDLSDYKVVTVVVTSPRMSRPVRRTTVIGDF